MTKRTLKSREVEIVDRRLKKTNSEKQIAYDVEVVHTSGVESVSGSKIFTDDAYFGDGRLNNIIITDSSIKQMRNGAVDTYYLPASGGTLALEGVIPKHTHNLITSGDGTLSINTSGEAFIETKNAPIGFCVSADVYDSANNASLVISFIVPMDVEDFSQATLSAMDSIVWEVKDLTNSVDVIPRQPLFMDFTKYGYDTDNNWLWIAVKDNTVVPNPNYSFPNYNWVQNNMNTPFHIAKNQDGTFSVSETWGPAAFSENSVAPVAAVVDKTEKVLTEEVAKTTYAKLSHSHNAIKGQSDDIEYTLTITGDSARLDKNSTANNIELTIGRYTPRHPSSIQGYTTIGTTNYRIDAYAGDAYRGGVSYERDKILIYPADYSPAKTILLPSADGRLALEGSTPSQIPDHLENGSTVVSAVDNGTATIQFTTPSSAKTVVKKVSNVYGSSTCNMEFTNPSYTMEELANGVSGRIPVSYWIGVPVPQVSEVWDSGTAEIEYVGGAYFFRDCNSDKSGDAFISNQTLVVFFGNDAAFYRIGSNGDISVSEPTTVTFQQNITPSTTTTKQIATEDFVEAYVGSADFVPVSANDFYCQPTQFTCNGASVSGRVTQGLALANNILLFSPLNINGTGMPFIGARNGADTNSVWYFLPDVETHLSAGQQILATTTDVSATVDAAIGEINTILDEINGEVI